MRILLATIVFACIGAASAQQMAFPFFSKAPASGGGGGGGLTIVQTNTVKIPHATSSLQWITNTFASVTSGNLLVLLWADEQDSSGALKNGVITDNHTLTWTLRARANAANSGNCEVWTAPINFTGSIFVTNTWNQNNVVTAARSQTLFEVSGQGASPIGNSGTNTASGAPSFSITSTKAGSIIFGVIADYAAKAPPVTLRSGTLRAQDDQTTSFYRGDYFTVPAPSVTSYSTGESAPTSQNAGMCVLEITP